VLGAFAAALPGVAPNQATDAEEQTQAGGGCLTGRICRPSTNPNSGTQTDTWEPRLGVRSRIPSRTKVSKAQLHILVASVTPATIVRAR